MRRIDLPGGHWADLREPGEITARARRNLIVASAKLKPSVGKFKDATPQTDLMDLDLTDDETDLVFYLQDLTIVTFLAAWSLDEPLPTVDTVGDIHADIHDALSQATGNSGAAIASTTLDMGTGGEPDPKDRTGASKPSSGRSKGASARTRTTKLSNGGARTRTGS